MKKLLISLILLCACNPTGSINTPSSCQDFCYSDLLDCLKTIEGYGMTKMDCSLLRDDCVSECKHEVE